MRVRAGTRWAAGLVAVSMVALGLVGCSDKQTASTGTAPRSDEFVGTWRSQQAKGSIVIAKTRSGYLGTFIFAGEPALSIPLTRDGDKLSGVEGTGVNAATATIVYLPASGHISWAWSYSHSYPYIEPRQMTKVSESTSPPTPSP